MNEYEVHVYVAQAKVHQTRFTSSSPMPRGKVESRAMIGYLRSTTKRLQGESVTYDVIVHEGQLLPNEDKS